MRLPQSSTARLVSCDVFDTILLRDHRSEHRRFGDIAALASRRFAQQLGTEIPPVLIRNARLQAQRQAYRALDLGCPTGDVRFADIVDATVRILGLDPAAGSILHDAEIAVERSQLSANTRLLEWLHMRAGAGSRIIAVSDIYHTAGTIADLLAAIAPRHPIAHIYTSADLNATKRSGSLFAAVLRMEGIASTEVLHIGDDKRADVTMARAAGLQALRLARPHGMRLRRRTDALYARSIEALRSPHPLTRSLWSDPT